MLHKRRAPDPPLSPMHAIFKMSLRQAIDAATLVYRCVVYILLPKDDGGSSLYFRILWRAVILYLYFWKFAWAFPAVYGGILRYTLIIAVLTLLVRWLCGLGKVFLYLHKRRRGRSSVLGSRRRSRSRSWSRRVSEVGNTPTVMDTSREHSDDDEDDDVVKGSSHGARNGRFLHSLLH